MKPCPVCGRGWPSLLYAAECCDPAPQVDQPRPLALTYSI